MNADSIKAKLKAFAVKSNITFQEALTYYGLERTIYRISKSKYAEKFVLKGGIFLYAVFDRDYSRSTIDVDLLARRISNSKEEMNIVFHDIFSQNMDDALVFDLNSIAVENITELKEYHGLHISVVGYLDKTRIPINIDIGLGDVIYPDAVKMDFPVILDMAPPKVNAHSLESCIAEKLEAIIHNGYLNSRYKDFYDIYIISRKYDFAYENLKNAVIETFENRKTPITMDSIVFSDEFLNDTMHQIRWKAFITKKKALIKVSMQDAISYIKELIGPILEGKEKTNWNSEKGIWE